MSKSKSLEQQFFNKIKKIIFFLFLFGHCNLVLADPKMDMGLDVYNNKAECGVCHT